LLQASIWGCGATPSREGTGKYVDDSVITTKVKAAILNDPPGGGEVVDEPTGFRAEVADAEWAREGRRV
jgi:hypothetical protein